MIPVNDDILFRAPDGIRTLRYTVAESASGSGALSAKPISNEVRPWLDIDTDSDLALTSCAINNNRIFVTTGGTENEAFKAMVVMDTAPTYGISTGEIPPAYNGIWTGLKFQQILQGHWGGKDRLLMIHRGATDSELWVEEEDPDVMYQDNGTKDIEARICTRAFDFGRPNVAKMLSHVDVWIRDLRGTASMAGYFRPDGYQLWNKLHSVTLASEVATAGALPQHRYRVRLPVEAEATFDPVTGINLQVGTTFQICLEWEGWLAIEKVILYALEETEDTDLICEDEVPVALVEGPGGEILDDFSYSSV